MKHKTETAETIQQREIVALDRQGHNNNDNRRHKMQHSWRCTFFFATLKCPPLKKKQKKTVRTIDHMTPPPPCFLHLWIEPVIPLLLRSPLTDSLQDKLQMLTLTYFFLLLFRRDCPSAHWYYKRGPAVLVWIMISLSLSLTHCIMAAE